jgi:hypothetical protein
MKSREAASTHHELLPERVDANHDVYGLDRDVCPTTHEIA